MSPWQVLHTYLSVLITCLTHISHSQVEQETAWYYATRRNLCIFISYHMTTSRAGHLLLMAIMNFRFDAFFLFINIIVSIWNVGRWIYHVYRYYTVASIQIQYPDFDKHKNNHIKKPKSRYNCLQRQRNGYCFKCNQRKCSDVIGIRTLTLSMYSLFLSMLNVDLHVGFVF